MLDPQATTTPPMLSIGEAADALGCRTHTLLHLLRTGQLPEPRRLGRVRMFDAVVLDRAREILARRQQQG